MKRLFDFTTSLIGLIVLFPVFIIVSVLVKTSSAGPVFFMQQRIGRRGRVFKMIKFRSMTVIQSSDSTISVKGDLRITKIGAFECIASTKAFPKRDRAISELIIFSTLRLAYSLSYYYND